MLENFGIIDPWIYALGALMIVLAPGPSMLYVLKASLTAGRRAGAAAILGVMLGDSLLIFLAYIGIAAAIKAHPEVFFWIKAAGGLYLAWLGVKVLWETHAAKKKASGEAFDRPVGAYGDRNRAVFKAFRTALALTLTNPKSILFYVSFFIQFIDETSAHTGISYLILALILQMISVTVLSLVVTLGADGLRRLARFPGVAKLGSTALGSLFLFFAGKLVLEA